MTNPDGFMTKKNKESYVVDSALALLTLNGLSIQCCLVRTCRLGIPIDPIDPIKELLKYSTLCWP